MRQTGNMRSESRDYHPAAHFSYQVFQSLVHFYFRQRKSLVFNISGVGHQKQDLRFIKD